MTGWLNPYVAGNPVGDSPAFVGRADVLREVLRVLRRPQDNAIVLYGQRRIGKTSVLQHLKARLPDEGPYHPVYFDLQDKADWPLARVLDELAQAIAHTLGQPGPNLGSDPEATFRDEWLPAILDDLPDDCSLVLLFDEFDVLADPQGEQAAKAFFPYLRGLLTSDPARLQFVFVIGRNVDDLDNIALSLFKGTPYRRVSLLDDQDTTDLVLLSQANGTLKWPDNAVEQVWQLTCGHPFLTQQLCTHIWERAYDEEPDAPPTVTPVEVKAAVPDALEASRNTMEWLWDGLGPAERVVTSALAEAGPVPITEDELERLLREGGVRGVIRELHNAPQLLQGWDILEPVDGGYRFRVELLRRWIAEHKPLHRVQDELDRIDPVADNLYQAAWGLYRGGQLDQAMGSLRQATELNPNHVKANQLLAEILLAQKQLDEAVQVLERLYEYQPAAARAYLVQALLVQAQATEISDEQLSLYERVLEIAPTQPEAIAGKGRIWRQRGEAALKDDELENALEAYRIAGLEDKVTEIEKEMHRRDRLADLYQRGLGALQSGDRQTAQNLLIEVLTLEPDYEEAARYLHLAVTSTDIVELQTRLNEVQRRYDELILGQVSKRVLGVFVFVALLLLSGGILAVNGFYFQPREATRQARATVAAISLANTATVEAAGSANRATESAQTMVAQATHDAENLDSSIQATANARATAAMATADACQDIGFYSVAIAPGPVLTPEPGTIYVSGSSEPYVAATWVVTNTGQCTWETVALISAGSGEPGPPIHLLRESTPVAAVAPGDAVEIVRVLSPQTAQNVDEEWVLVVNGLSLFDQAHLRLRQEEWITAVTPTPTHTPTQRPPGTSTPTLTSTPGPTTPVSVAPQLVAPEQGGTYQNPITFQWRGSLSAGQLYQVAARGVTPGREAIVQSGPLEDPSWTTDLPEDKKGEWRWTVSVIQDGRTIVTSDEGMFWFGPPPVTNTPIPIVTTIPP